MALVLVKQVIDIVNADKIQVYDNTQDYIDGTDGGYGVVGNPNRSDTALLFYTTYIDENGTVTYLTQDSHLVGSNTLFSVADGLGLANTDKSLFVVNSTQDGQHIYYMASLERDNTKVGGTQGDMYYNIDDDLPYYFNGTTWELITDDLLDTVILSSMNQANTLLMRKRARTVLAEVTRDIYSVDDGYDQALKEGRDDYSARLFLAKETFNSGNESSGRVLIDNLKKFRF